MKIFTSGMKMQHKMLLDVSAGESIKNKTNEEQFHKTWEKKFRPRGSLILITLKTIVKYGKEHTSSGG
jgi:hypothetical protein